MASTFKDIKPSDIITKDSLISCPITFFPLTLFKPPYK